MGGKAQMRHQVLSYLASNLDLKDRCIDDLYRHITENFSNRKDLAIAWLSKELLKTSVPLLHCDC